MDARPAQWSADPTSPIASRPGRSPEVLGVSHSNETCPDILRVTNGDYLVIGTDVTPQYLHQLPDDAGCADHERIVMIPATTFHAAAGGEHVAREAGERLERAAQAGSTPQADEDGAGLRTSTDNSSSAIAT